MLEVVFNKPRKGSCFSKDLLRNLVSLLNNLYRFHQIYHITVYKYLSYYKLYMEVDDSEGRGEAFLITEELM